MSDHSSKWNTFLARLLLIASCKLADGGGYYPYQNAFPGFGNNIFDVTLNTVNPSPPTTFIQPTQPVFSQQPFR